MVWHYWSRQFKEFGCGTRLDSQIILHKPKGIAIGSNVVIKSRCRIEAINTGKNPDVIRLRIGDNTSFQQGCQVSAADRITIGKDVLIGSNVLITDNDHIYDHPTLPPSAIRELYTAPVTIEDGCWLGFSSIVLKGVTIGKRAVISANAVVTHDIPPFSVAAGIPARIIKHFTPQEE